MTNVLKNAQKASATDLLRSLDPSHTQIHVQDKTFNLSIAKAAKLSSSARNIIWEKWRANMEVLYKSTTVFEWNPAEKRKELFHTDSRFILAVPEGKRLEDGNLAAFVMFRFDTEEDIDGVDENVLYCYEIQVTESCRNTGLGKNLMTAMKELAKEWSMTKVMLTAFLVNTAALRFYQREGFVVDAISPEDDEYHILSWTV